MFWEEYRGILRYTLYGDSRIVEKQVYIKEIGRRRVVAVNVRDEFTRLRTN